jgi:2-dehydro-3-deoxyphosphogluconate aldolase/(4S)-4-hydroxy-2-oxoglutarate aldolase
MRRMTKETTRTQILDIGIIPSIRTSSADDARFAAETVAQAGIPIVEITMTVPGALEIIEHLAYLMPTLAVGAGTVLDVETARRCVDAGARFITSPGLDCDIVAFTLRKHVLAIPGALTPTEVTAAVHAQADLVKIFPCAQVGGASYIHALKAPFPDARLIAAGGVNQQTAADFITAGAAAVGVGAELIPRKAIHERDVRWITELARRFMHIVHEARGQPTGHGEAVDRRSAPG